MSEKTKKCGKCRMDKSPDSFPRDKSRPDGRYSYCKACNTERVCAINRKKTQERQEARRLAELENPATEKPCTACGVVQGLEQFQREDSGLHGRRSKCNSCRRIYQRQLYQDQILISRRRSRLTASRLCERLSDSYVKGLLTKHSNLRNADIPPQLVELKRIQLRIKRMTEDLENEKR